MSLADDLIGKSTAVAALRAQVDRLLARQNSAGSRLPPILILGETGVGKGLLVRSIHRASSRSRSPLIEVNCAAIPEHLVEAELFGYERGAFTDARQAKPGLFQAAHDGVLFLDEIGMLPPGAQAKLLTALDQRQVRRIGGTRTESVDTWVLSATNEDLAAAMAQGRFRADLYHRISLVTLRLAPLRERGRDVIALAEHFLRRACADYGLPSRRLTDDAQLALLSHTWPGNVRELANLMERTALFSDGVDITAEALQLRLPADRRREPSSDAETERRAIQGALEATQWNLSKAAQRLGIARNTLRYRIERLGLRPADASQAVSPPLADDASRPVLAPEMRVVTMRWERRWITALRVALTVPDDMNESLLMPVLESVVDKAVSFGASLDGVRPTGVTLLFGLDPMEGGAHRAALAAQAVHVGVLRATADRIAATCAIHVAECSIARGVLASGVDADEKRRVGDVLDALLRRAAVGDTIVSDSGARFLRRTFELRALESDEPSITYSLGDQFRTQFTIGEHARSPFVGRKREMSYLGDLFAEAESGRGQLVGLVGEPGVGKSRLLYEFLESVGRDRVAYYEGRCMTYGRSTPYFPFIGLCRAAFQFAESAPSSTIAQRVREAVDPLGLHTDAIVAYLLHMLGVADTVQKAVPKSSPEAMRIRIMETLRQVLVATSQRRPVIVALEDLQWIDPTSQEIVGTLADSIAACPVFLVMTYRHGYRPPWLDKSYASQLVLRRLARGDSEAIVTAAQSARPLTSAVVERIVARAGGVPFFLEEMTRAISEGGPTQAEAAIPETIQEVVAARFDRLPREDQEILEAASVMGKDGVVSLLREIAGLSESRFDAAFARLRAGQFIYDTVLAPLPHYTFEHVLTQEVVYHALAQDRRRTLHASAAAAIERSMPNVAEREPELLAYHCAEGGMVRQAIGYWLRAGQLASRRSAHAEAIAHLERGLALLQSLPDTPDRGAKELGFRLSVVGSLLATRGHESVDATLARAQELAKHLDESPQLFPLRFGLWRLSTARAQLAASEEAATTLLDTAEQAQDRALLMPAHLAFGVTAFFMGRLDQARSHIERSLTLYDTSDAPLHVLAYGQNLEASALGYLGSVLAILGDLDQAADCVDRGLAIARRSDHPFTLTFALMLCGHVRQHRREATAVAVAGEELETLSHEQGIAWFPAVALGLKGWAEFAQAPSGPGLDMMREGARMFMTFHQIGLAYRTHLAEALIRSGFLDEARAEIQAIFDHADKTRERSHLADAYRLEGEALSFLSRPEEAQACFNQAFDISTAQGARLFALRAAMASVQASARTGQRPPAADVRRLASVYETFTEGLDLEDLLVARRLLEAVPRVP